MKQIGWKRTTLGSEIALEYGKSLPASARTVGSFRVFGSNGPVGTNNQAIVDGPGIVVGRKGSVGKVTYSESAFWPIDTTYYVLNRNSHDWRFIYFLLQYLQLDKLDSPSPVPGLNRDEAYRLECNLPPKVEQERIGRILGAVGVANEINEDAIKSVGDLKRGVTHRLFTRGLRGEAQRETEIGPVPKSWAVGRLDRYADIISTRMTYSDLEELRPAQDKDAVRVLGIKVADMNVPGNEIELRTAALEKLVSCATAQHRCAPPRTIIFPKRGAAIATNKKRISTQWTVFDPNVIGVIGGNELDQNFLFHWFQTFDLRTITEPGPTPQLNKKDLEPLIIPVPPTREEQREIVAVLETIDRKIDVHRKKSAVLEELFRAVLHKLMTGEIRVTDLDVPALPTSNQLVDSAKAVEASPV